jgi:hypothetical protein
MYAINGIEVSESDFLAHEDSIVSGKDVYIRPVYRNAWFVGFCVYVRGECARCSINTNSPRSCASKSSRENFHERSC